MSDVSDGHRENWSSSLGFILIALGHPFRVQVVAFDRPGAAPLAVEYHPFGVKDNQSPCTL
jgi:hypothetical protein